MNRAILLAASLLILSVSTPRAATITIVNQDGPNEGFNDPTVVAPEGGNIGVTRGQQRLNVFQAAANIWGAQLQSNIQIKVGARFDSISPCSTSGGVLGFAGPGTFTTLSPTPPGYFSNTWYAIAEAEAVRNTNLNSSNNEIDATFNSDIDTGCLGAGTRFWYGIDSTPVPNNRVALLPTVLHELGHGLGFLTLVNTNTGALASGIPDIWTYFLKNAQTGELWKDMTNGERVASAIDDPRLIWDGPAVTASIPTFQPTNAGVNVATGRMRMYAPNPLEPGSSVSHWTDDAASPNLLMEPAINSNLFAQTDMTVPLFQDIGWPLVGNNTISIADRTLGEATTPMNFTLTRSNSSGTASVVVSTAAGTATGGGTDYTNVSSQTVNFADGSATATLNVTINNDAIDEIDETFVVNLTSPSAGYTISDAQATGTITDDDTSSVAINNPAAVTEGSSINFNVTLSTPNSRTVTVRADTANGTATSSGDYTARSNVTVTFTPGDVSETFTVSTQDDNLDEPDSETFAVNLSNVSNAVIGDNSGTGTINDNEATPTISIADAPAQAEDNVNPLRYVVTLSGASQSTITVRADTANGTATAGSDYTARSNVTITFPSGDVSENFDVSKNVDLTFEADETVLVNLSNVSAGASILDGSASGTISNDDPGPLVSIADGSLTEPAVTTNMPFTISIPSAVGADVTVNFSTSPIDATPGSDYTAATGSATITAGNTTGTVNIPILHDTTDEFDEQFLVTLAPTSTALIGDGVAIGTIIDNDSGGDPVFRNGFE